MKILLTKLSEGIGHQIIDAWHAYRQHKNSQNKYAFHAQYHVMQKIDQADFDDYDFSILSLGIKQTETLNEQYLSRYNLVLICNGGEPLKVCVPSAKDWLSKYSHVYLVSNAYLAPDHVMYDKNLWFPNDVQTCRDLWTRHFYPQYFDNKTYQNLPRKNILEFINGATRSNRQYFIDLCKQSNINLDIKNPFGSRVIEVADSQWESDQDTIFKNFVNERYETVWEECGDYTYYDQSVSTGINDCFGSIPPGYFNLPLYFENHCVVFPESGWQNNELNITEKALKCFFAGSLPFPIGGSNVNKMYNELGFYTAWNLLPTDLQQIDSEPDHAIRYQGMTDCIKWLLDNAKLFDSEIFHDMTNSNRLNFLTCDCDHMAIHKFDQIMQKHLPY